ncbi:MAG: fused MFS/spermidine synthase [Desulfovibrio sp.]|nr:fused MFS/spermidine synthase [Desulfovibrio sp.]
MKDTSLGNGLAGCTAFANGALVMILEMVGARLMAPHLGTSVIVWTSLIGILMAFLALGAFLGGRLADRRLSRRTLSMLFAGSGAGVALTALVHETLGGKLLGGFSNIYVGAVLGAGLYFALPALLFGAISPYLIRLQLADIERSGATVGRLYALSTAGSILGTFLGGFVLISWFGSTQILFGVAVCAGLIALLAHPRKNPMAWCLLAFGLFAAIASDSYGKWRTEHGYVLRETPYNTIRVFEGVTPENRRVRLVRTDPGKIQSGMFLDDPRDLFAEYTRYLSVGTTLHPGARRLLLLGGGGYSLPRWLLDGGSHLKDFTLDVVELDPGMTQVAKEYFLLPADRRMRIFHEDARGFLNRNVERYDIVFVDVFTSCYTVPFHMGTREAMAALARSVAPGGMCFMNVISAFEGDRGLLFRAIHAAICEAFPEVHVYAMPGAASRDALQNIIILALPERRPDLAVALEGRSDDLPGTVRVLLKTHSPDPVPHDVPPMTDALAPAERYALSLITS